MSWASSVRHVVKLPSPTFFRPTFPTEQVDWSRLVAIDFETFYDDDYTLSKLSTSEYVRDPRFEALMMGVKVGKKKRVVIPGPKIATFLKTIPWSTHTLLCHNTQFDGFILSHHYGVVPAKYYCTLSIARGLHSNEIGAGLDEVAQFYGRAGKLKGNLEKMKGRRYKQLVAEKLYDQGADYCGVDVDEMLGIFQEMLPNMPRDEIDLIDLTVRMFCDPVLKVDIPRVEAELKRELARRKELLMAVVPYDAYEGPEIKTILKTAAERALTGDERIILKAKRLIGSNEKFADLLRAEGIEPPRKISPAWIKKPKELRTDEDKYAYAFAKDDEKFINLPDDVEALCTGLNLGKVADIKKLAERQERLRNLVDCRIAVKSTTNVTRAERFLKAGANGWSLPCGYAYYRAHTGRWGGNNKMNMQNLTRGGELRMSILAAPGHNICTADSGQIEARVNAWLWDQLDLLEAFAVADKWDKSEGVARGSDRDAYCRFADLIYRREITTDDKTERFVGKVCVAGDTLVLTNHGLKSIIEVRLTDLLWDGTQWVQHNGLVHQGVKEVIRYRNLAATADHEILTEHGWQEWSEVLIDHSLFQSALVSATLPSSDGIIIPPPKVNLGVIGQSAVVRAGVNPWFMPAISNWADRLVATLAPKSPQTLSAIGSTRVLCRMMSIVPGYSTGFLQRLAVAIIREMRRLNIMARAALQWRQLGSQTVPLSFFMQKPSLVGMCLKTRWTALTRIWGMPREIFVLSRAHRTQKIDEKWRIWSNESAISKERTQTYDLANAGPKHRFTVITEDGPLIIHNCVLGLGYQMGSAKLQITLAKGALGGPPVFFTLDECKAIINTYRRKNYKIRDGWEKCKEIIEDMAAGRTGAWKCISWEANTIWLPNGMSLKYPDLKKSINEDTGYDEWTYQSGDQRKKIYGGLLCENLVQALARIIVGWQMLQISRKYRVVMTTHDEVSTHVKTKLAPAAFAFMQKMMKTPLEWCQDIPLNCEGGYDVNYSK